MGPIEFLAARQFTTSSARFYAQRVVAHPCIENGHQVGRPVWHFVEVSPNVAPRPAEWRACMNERGPDKLVMSWVSPWFDSLEACYLYAELNQWGM